MSIAYSHIHGWPRSVFDDAAGPSIEEIAMHASRLLEIARNNPDPAFVSEEDFAEDARRAVEDYVGRMRLAEDQAARRHDAQQRFASEIDDKLKQAIKAKDLYSAECEFCRGIPKGNRTLKYDCDWEYGFLVNEHEQTATCPKCGDLVAEWEY
jgi:rubrerythrin